MSLSRRTRHSSPDQPEGVPEHKRHYIGKDKPKVNYTYITYKRAEVANRLHLPLESIADEPDSDTLMDIDRE